MKILHVLYSGLGGHGNVFFSMVGADSNKEFEHEALFNGVEDLREEYIERCAGNAIAWNFVKKKRGFDPGFYKKLVTAIRRSGPEIIFLHGSTAILPAKMATWFIRKKQKIITRETQANELKTSRDWLTLKAAMLLSTKTIFLSEAYDEEIRKKHLWFYRKKHIAIIPNGIDLQKFDLPVKQGTDTVIIGMQSRIVKIKDHETLLLAFAQLLKDPALSGKIFMLKIAGDGDSREQLQQLVKELTIQNNVEFTGILIEDELVKFLTTLDIYVHASLGETMSTAIMQAMAADKPVIASNVPGINNMIADGVTGLLVPVQDAQLLYEKIKQLILSPVESGKLSANAHAYAMEHFSNETMFSKYRALFLAE